MSSEGSNSSKSSVQQTPLARKPMELISQAIRNGASGNGVDRANDPSPRSSKSDTPDGAEAVRVKPSPGETSTSKPERGTEAAASRPALELDDDDDDDQGEPGDRAVPKRKTLDEIADEAGLSKKALFKALVDVEIEGEEPVSVATLKHHYQQTRDFEKQKDTFEHERDQIQTEILASRSQVDGVKQKLINVVGEDMFKRILGDVLVDQSKFVAQSKAQLLEWYPQWSDVRVLERDRVEIEEVLGTYGWTKHDVANLVDARIIKFVRDSVKLRKRYDRLKAGTVEKQPTTQPASRKAHRPSSWEQAKTMADRGDKDGAISRLIEGG